MPRLDLMGRIDRMDFIGFVDLTRSYHRSYHMGPSGFRTSRLSVVARSGRTIHAAREEKA